MSKINEIIQNMKQLLEGNDLSNTPYGRKLAQEYADICDGINESLKECRSLFQMGAYAEARKMNQKAVPSYTERYDIVNFAERDRWIDLCRMYDWPLPPMLDEETVSMLLSGDKGKELTIEELQNQWRAIIRGGSIRAKLLLARKIYLLDNSSVSRSNLLNVERPWVNQLKKEADAALAENREKDLAEIYKELVSPELLQKVPDSALKKYQALVNKSNQASMEAEKKEVLAAIASCYAAMLIPELEAALSDWKKLETNPLFHKTKEEILQIEEATKFLTEQQTEISAKKKFEDLQNQLELLLNEDGEPAKIDHTYHSLQQMDRPIEQRIEERMSDFYDRQKLESHRKHVRHCLYWGFSAVAVTALLFTGIFLIQRERELKTDCEKIKVMLQDRQFNAAIQYCEKIAQERPSVAKRSALIALKKQAESMYADAQTAAKVFDEHCENLKKNYLKEETILDPQVKILLVELDRQRKKLPEEYSTRLTALQKEYQDILESLRQKKELEFSQKGNEIQDKWRKLFQEFDLTPVHDSRVAATQLQIESDRLLEAYKEILDPAKYNDWKLLFNGNMDQLQEREKAKLNLENELKGLLHPDSTKTYFDALKQLDKLSGDLAGEFTKASLQIPREEILYALITSSAPSKIEQASDQYMEHPYCRMVKTWLDTPMAKSGWFAKQKNKVSELENVLLPQWKLYEMTFRSKGVNYFLYFEKPEEEVLPEWTWDGKKLKAVRLIFTIEKNQKIHSAVKVKYLGNGKNSAQGMQTGIPAYYYTAGQIFDKFPEMIVPTNKNVFHPKSKLELSQEYQLLQASLDVLRDKPYPKMVFDNLLNIVSNTENCNPYARAILMRQYIDLLPMENNPVYTRELQELVDFLGNFTSKGSIDWRNPANTFAHQTDSNVFQSKLKSLNLRRRFSNILLHECLVKRCKNCPPVAVGVFYREKDCWRLHSFGDSLVALDELLIIGKVDESKPELLSYAFSPTVFGRNVDEKKIAPDMKKLLYPGMLVYAPKTLGTWKQEFQKACLDIKGMQYDLPVNSSDVLWPDYWPVNCRNVKEMLP